VYGVSLLFLVVVLYIAIKVMLKNIPVLLKKIESLSDGDLITPFQIKSRDEIGLIAEALERMRRNLRETLQSVDDSSKTVSEASKEIKIYSERNVEATNGITSAVVHIAENVEEQTDKTNKCMVSMEILSTEMEHVSVIVNKLENISNNTENLTSIGVGTIQDLLACSYKNTEAMDSIRQIVNEVDVCSNEITSIIDTIEAISEQTNLLALNASIEAARSGEAGRGFAVVASQIKSLAGDTYEATDEIRRKIESIQSISNEAVKKTENSLAIAEENEEAVDKTKEVLEEITVNTEDLYKHIHEILKVNSNMEKERKIVYQLIELLTDLSATISAATQQVSASTQEQLAGIEESNLRVIESENCAIELVQKLEKFTI